MITQVDAFLSNSNIKRRKKRKNKKSSITKPRLSPRRVIRRAKKR